MTHPKANYGPDIILPPIALDEEGKDPANGVKYINIYDEGKDDDEGKLGRMLSPVNHMPFTHPLYGPFQNFQAFWEWIKSDERPDSIRYVSGKQAVRIGRSLTKIYLANFQQLVEQALFCQIDQNERLRKEFLCSALPFEMYYVRNPETPQAIAIRPSNRDIIVQALTKVRELMWHESLPEGMENYVRPRHAR